MALFSFLRRLLVVALVFIPLVFSCNSAKAENWVFVDSGPGAEIYHDTDYYHIDSKKRIEYIRVKVVMSDGSSVVQRWKHYFDTNKYEMK